MDTWSNRAIVTILFSFVYIRTDSAREVPPTATLIGIGGRTRQGEALRKECAHKLGQSTEPDPGLEGRQILR
jgi:hypothetical protein